ncbi:MAG: hypothetical protein E6Q50_01125 [Lysobacter sp.]|nr:MAG: hypothetical protein E6Q50_01125 [Lysobacter sp.]
MSDSVSIVSDEVLYAGRLLDLVSRTLEVRKGNDSFCYSIEVARRPPGVRLIVYRDREYLLLREYRSELSRWDFRLGGGKIFETQAEHLKFISECGNLIERAKESVVIEAREELGVEVNSASFIRKSCAGATIEWDLYFFQIDTFTTLSSGPQPEHTELLSAEWHSPESIIEMIKNGAFSEDRSIGVIMQHMLNRRILP